jgi:hypothetical protein
VVQQGTGLQGPGFAAQGGSVTVDVSNGGPSVTVNTAGAGPGASTVPVGSGGKATFPVPNVPVGTVIVVIVGKGLNRSFLYIEVVAPGP